MPTITGPLTVCRIPISLNAEVSRKLEAYAAVLGGVRHKGRIVSMALEEALAEGALDKCLERGKPRPTGRAAEKNPDGHDRIVHTLRVADMPVKKVTRYANKKLVSRSILIESILVWWFKRIKAEDL